ncbi:MAG: hypothetical protein KKB20_15280 [Proteobacteria bacterium]|nr:hypothetical protein [Pseudomonadota bacterium]
MKRGRSLFGPIAAILVLLLLPGCLNQGQVMADEKPAPPSMEGRYYDFADVKIPADLELNREGSFVYESESFKAGILGFKGREDAATELVNFFQENMAKDGWSLLSSFKYNKNILIYTKPDKVCLIVITLPVSTEGLRVEAWVSPLKSQSASQKTMQPFLKREAPPAGKTSAPKEETLKN